MTVWTDTASSRRDELVRLFGVPFTVEPVAVNGQPGFWIQGAPHLFFYRVGGSTGSIEQETLRLAGNTLIWTQGNLLLRLEAQVDKATALRIAASIH